MSAVLYEKKDKIAYITLNRPEALNALTAEMMKQLGEARIRFKEDPDAWICIITGAGGKAFSVGADVKALIDKLDAGEAQIRPYRPFSEEEMATDKPVIAAIDGWCLAEGTNYVLSFCDIRIATAKSRFGIPQAKIGRNDAGGGPFRLPAQIPFAVAMEMLLTAEPIDARRAYELGLINQVVETSEDLMPAAEKMAEKVLACAPLAVRLMKEQALRLFNQPIPVQLSMRDLGEEINLSQDAAEGIKAFTEKRNPNWQAK